ncbi:uncharacterized protein Tco025E_01908 [Trypanosoma conorhini]|uniref:Uncharacterized protein n=1 Tax=Trypanosoma conorhini TaxID=83891 RepID=A0A422Q7H7_9TRYP|nr:uncharacterized protein Tco025E_01908 [Trypanosoma conorhini]RNF25904.1 hypothetical protein Tco025E_01908 [Trypanosoma conorhini]
MLHRTSLRHVHLFTALVPVNSVKAPRLISGEQLETAKKAVVEAEPLLGKAPLGAAFDLMADLSNFHKQRELDRVLEECITFYRSELYKPPVTDPFQRLQLHEAIMAAGFYQRSAKKSFLKGESTRFVLNHYNFDLRRDNSITRTVHKTLQEGRTSTTESDKLLGDLLLLERRLFGRMRFAPTAGRQWFVLGLPLEDIKTEADVHRVLNIPVVKQHGNFETKEEDLGKLWKKIIVFPNTEPTSSFYEDGGIETQVAEKDLRLECRIQKPAPPLEFWDRVKDTLLRYWVIWFSLWIMFFMVDEEIITVVALIFLKWRQTQILEEEAEKTGGKVYIASASGRSRDSL